MPARGDQSFQFTPWPPPSNTRVGSRVGMSGLAGASLGAFSPIWWSKRSPRATVIRFLVKVSPR